MVDSFIFHIDWIIVSVVIGLLVAVIGAFSGINAIAVRPFLQSDRAIFNENRSPPRSWW